MADRLMSRRTVITAPVQAAIKAALAGIATVALASSARAQQKRTKEQAQYQDEPKAGILMCGTCTHFVAPSSCKVVEGDVAITGWCNVFDLAD